MLKLNISSFFLSLEIFDLKAKENINKYGIIAKYRYLNCKTVLDISKFKFSSRSLPSVKG